MKSISAKTPQVRFDQNTTVNGDAKLPSGQSRTIKGKARAASEGMELSRSHVKKAVVDVPLSSIAAPPKPRPPKPLPKTEAVRQQAFMQKIASEQPPRLTLMQLDRQIRDFVRLDAHQSRKLLATVSEGSADSVSSDQLRAFRHCVQGQTSSLSPEMKQQAQDFARAYLKLPKADNGARTGFNFDPMMTIYSLDFAVGKF